MANQPDSGPKPACNRPVKPRKSAYVNKPIMAIDNNEVLMEDGEVLPFADLPVLLRTQPSSILVAHHFGAIIKYLDTEFEGNPLFQFRASPVERSSWAPGRKLTATMRDCIIGYVGFKGENKKKGHYHYPLSPYTFCLKTVNELRRGIPDEKATLVKLMEWAKEVRDFLQKNELNLSPTSGGIAAQLLKDKRFYPEPRRKVPRHTNSKAREELPGNFYKLYAAVEGRGMHNAAYLDQTSAHHTAARDLKFPNANTLYRRGRYNTLEDRSFAKAGTERYKKLIAEHGLFYLAYEAPKFFPTDFPLPECDRVKSGYGRGYFYSNELPYLKTLGVRIRHIIACWTSPDTDPGLNRYAEWALREIDSSPFNSKKWLKPTLLSTYGVLASKPKKMEFGYKQAKGGKPKKYPCGSGFLDVQVKVSEKLREPAMSNVIHRGMVEAQTRLTSLEFARELAKQGHTILAVYADSIFVEDGLPLPLLPKPWRVQDFLTALKFESSTHFTSLELSKTPGIPAHLRARAKLPARPKRKAKATT